MNLQNLTKEQLNMFCMELDCNLSEFKPIHNNCYYMKMFTGFMGPQLELHITENSCVGINYYKGYNLTEQWLEF